MTSPFTTLYSLAFCLWHISLAPLLALNRERKPVFADLVLLNGPGSCVPIACATFLPRVRPKSTDSSRQESLAPTPRILQIVGLPSASLVYIESLARTRRLSLSAQLVRPLVDRFFVQWDSLRDELVKAEARKGERPRWKAKVECQGWLV